MSNHVKLTKLTRLPDRPNGVLEAVDGTGVILEGYSIKGHFEHPPKCGERFVVKRYERNGVTIDGEFSTSPVVEYGDLYDDGRFLVRTQNSIYLCEDLG